MLPKLFVLEVCNCLVLFQKEIQHPKPFQNGYKQLRTSEMTCFGSVKMLVLLPKRYGIGKYCFDLYWVTFSKNFKVVYYM